MPILNWIGKDKVINHHQQVPYRVLEPQYTYGQADSGNMIVHGDNLDALKALLPRYEGRVKLVYIDPPYNTGNENWVYNDNVNDPKIKKWLGEVVGKEGEDLSRHDKWLCMMYPRLKLLQKLLADDGIMVISIGYHEIINLSMICKEIFATCQIVPITVQTSGGKPSGGFNYLQEYLVFIVPKDFQPNPLQFNGGNSRTPFEGLTLATFNKTNRPNQVYPIFIDEKTGLLAGVGKSLQDRIDEGTYSGEKADFVYDYSEAPEGMTALWPISSKGNECVWRLISKRLLGDWKKGYIKISKRKSGVNKNEYSIQYLPEGVINKIESGELSVMGTVQQNTPTLRFGENKTVGSEVPTIWTEKDFFTVRGTGVISDIFNEKAFEYPKPVELIEEIIRATTNPGDIILDSFAGSGSTAHAILNMNSNDEGNRHFLLVEMSDYADNLTAARIKRVIDGYVTTQTINIFDEKITTQHMKSSTLFESAMRAKEDALSEYATVKNPTVKDGRLIVEAKTSEGEPISGTGGGFAYYELGERLLLEDGNLNEDVPVDRIREYVWYTETRADYTPQKEGYLLGVRANTAYYFYYERERVTVLDRSFLRGVKTKAGGYLIYADINTLSPEEMDAANIRFKKIPRDITRL
jgi:adenine-specific DNA-methyltransferase